MHGRFETGVPTGTKNAGFVPREEPDARDLLLDAIEAYALEHGLGACSLRPLGAAVGASPRTLLYYFESKDALVAALLERVRRRQIELFEAWTERSSEHDARALFFRAWQWVSAARHEPLLRLAFETYALGIRDKRRYGAHARAAIADWSGPLAVRLEREGFARERARSLGTLLAATMRGLIADVLATGERSRADRAFRSFLAAIEFEVR